MAANVGLNFTPLTNPRTWFVGIDAFNAWVADITVSIGSENLPEATTTDLGGVLQATVAAYAPAAVVPTWVTLSIDGVDTLVPSQQAYNDLHTKLNALVASYEQLRAALIASGALNVA